MNCLQIPFECKIKNKSRQPLYIVDVFGEAHNLEHKIKSGCSKILTHDDFFVKTSQGERFTIYNKLGSKCFTIDGVIFAVYHILDKYYIVATDDDWVIVP